MDDICKLVKAYRFTKSLPERLSAIEEVIHAVQTDLRLFVLGSVRPPAADDVMQETLKGIAVGLAGFRGNSKEEFWGWCYRITRNKINDHYRKKANDRATPMPEEELRDLIDFSMQLSPPTAEVRHDLEHVMQLLIKAKPVCYDFLWKHYVFGLSYHEIAAEQNVSYDGVRMRIGRCLEEAKTLVS